MNGVHDMGGDHGFGAVPVDDTAQFHADWERTVYGMDKLVKATGTINIDEKRHAIERMPPAEYLGSTYFERWLDGLERLMVEKGVATETEIAEAKAAAADGTAVPERSDADLVALVREAFAAPSDFERPGKVPEFEVGDDVRVRNINPEGHTRCPRYARRAHGEIHAVHGNHVFPDANAHGEERAEPLYTVAFTATELWGPDAEAETDTIHIDLWEPYLRPLDGDHQ
ncbi:MAG: nitrile hydratase subunit beta [Salinirussus sp.]